LKEFFLKNPFQNFSFAKPSASRIPASLICQRRYISESRAEQGFADKNDASGGEVRAGNEIIAPEVFRAVSATEKRN